MKKSILIAVLGLAAGVASSFGQGYIYFNSYIANSGLGAQATMFPSGTPLGASFTADLYFAIGTVSDPVNSSTAGSLPTGFTSLGVVGVTYDGNGYFVDGNPIAIPTYTSGPISFEVVAYNGSSYANSTIRGRSGSFTESTIGTSLSSPITNFGDNGSGMPNFVAVAVVPEPTTLALAGLGGLAALVAFRRKQV